MTKWHAHVAHMTKHTNMVGGPGPPKSGAAWGVRKSLYFCERGADFRKGWEPMYQSSGSQPGVPGHLGVPSKIFEGPKCDCGW